MRPAQRDRSGRSDLPLQEQSTSYSLCKVRAYRIGPEINDWTFGDISHPEKARSTGNPLNRFDASTSLKLR